jgi:hypothetical protein
MQLPVHVQVVELPLVVQLPAVQSKVQSAVSLHAKAHDCPSRHVALHVEPAAHAMLQLVESWSHSFSQVFPSPQASLFPAFAESSSLQATKARESKAAAVISVLNKFIGLSWART